VVEAVAGLADPEREAALATETPPATPPARRRRRRPKTRKKGA
jgi:hypothetical protein